MSSFVPINSGGKKRDTTSLANKNRDEELEQPRSDMLFTTKSGIEVGNGEIKSANTCPKKLDVDRARIAELCKRQLHLRMMAARCDKELKTFGLFIHGESVNDMTPVSLRLISMI